MAYKNINRTFNVGDKVWVYDCPCEPRHATIIEKLHGLDVYKVEYKNGREKIRVHSVYSIYKYPDDLYIMICHMKDDSFHIDRMASHFEEFSSDLENPNNPIGWS